MNIISFKNSDFFNTPIETIITYILVSEETEA